MRLILRDEVDKLGKRGDIVTVSRGFARNYLLPKRLAMEVNDDNLRHVEKEKKLHAVKMAKEKAEAETLAASFSGVSLSFSRKVHGDSEELYGSVSSTDIAEALEQKGFVVEKRKILLDEPVKVLGELTVDIKLHAEVSVSIPVKVEKEEE